MEKQQRDYFINLEKRLAQSVKPVSPIKVSEWAEKYRNFSPEASAKKGGQWTNLPMQIEPMDCCLDPDVEGVVMVWASQAAGKTEVLLNITGYFMHQDPSPIMIIQPTLEMAEDWSTRRLSTMIRDTKPLADLFDNKRTSGNKTLEKSYPGGSICIAGSNSPASLASRPIRIVIKDEPDRFAESAGSEGDPILLAAARQETFYNAFDAEASTPTIKGHSRIEKSFEQTDKRYWFCQCPSCGFEQTLKWRQLKWESEDKAAEAYYECENGECPNPKWTDEMRIEAIRAGRWKATAPFNGRRGYHLNGLYSLFRHKRRYKNKLHQFVSQFLTVKKIGTKTAMKVWTNTFLAETWSDDEDAKINWVKLYERREKYTPQTIPQKVKILTAGIDVQADRIELEIVGFGEHEESWGIEYQQIWGDTRNPEIYKRLDEQLTKAFVREDGATLFVNAVGMDTGYAAAIRQVYAYLRPRLSKRYYPLKGSSIRNAEIVAYSGKGKVDRLKILMVGTNKAKTILYNRTTIENEGPGFMHFPEKYEAEFFKQLLSEDSITVAEKGQSFQVFSLPTVTPENSSSRNEALDMRVYSLAALYARGIPNWALLERKLKKTIEENAKPAEKEVEQKKDTPETQSDRPRFRIKKRLAKRGSFVRNIVGF